MSFLPVATEVEAPQEYIPLAQLAAEVQDVLNGEGGEFLQRLLQMGGSPQGARPKALLYRSTETGEFSTADAPGLEPWLIKFPANHEHPEVCAIEATYSRCLHACGIDTPETAYFQLPNGQAAFATKRFDRKDGMRIPMQSLAAFLGADYRNPGTLDYVAFLRATQICTNDVREKAKAFERAVFNVAFNNRDDHPKNFSYLMTAEGRWTLAPAYDVTYCEGPGGYHQMDVMGEALDIRRAHLLKLAEHEAELSSVAAGAIIDRICASANTFAATATHSFPGQITPETLKSIQHRIKENVARLQAP